MTATVLKSGLACLVVTLLSAASLLAEQQDQVRAKARVVPAKATTGEYIRKYQITAAEGSIVPGHVRVKLGEKVRITFVSVDSSYAIRFKDFGIKEKLTPDQPVVVELTPRTAGTFEFRCSRWGVKRFANNGEVVVSN